MAEEAAKKKSKKLSKDLATEPGSVIITAVGGEKGAMKFPFKKLPPKIQELFGPLVLAISLAMQQQVEKGRMPKPQS